MFSRMGNHRKDYAANYFQKKTGLLPAFVKLSANCYLISNGANLENIMRAVLSALAWVDKSLVKS